MGDGKHLALGQADTALGTEHAVDATLPDPKPAGRSSQIEVAGYRIARVIGEGGMGTVYEAEQQQPKRRVAIKVMHGRSPTALSRFRAEAEIMARLDHPGIARVLAAGEAMGSPYLVMDYVDGVTLDRHVARLDVRQRLGLFVDLCDAVHHAHVKGVIHRDLKPANVMVRDGARVVVLDFGVARLAQADRSSSPETRAGELIGTPLYMSPEQAELRADEVDARTDVYTLGVIMYELACSQLPYDLADRPVAAIMGIIIDAVPVPLGKRDKAFAGDLEAIAAKALEKEPERRYQSVAALADDVRRYLARQLVSVRMPTPVERAARFVKRRPLLAATIAGSVGAAVVFAAVVTYLWRDATDARHVAEEAREKSDAAFAELETRTAQRTADTAEAAVARDPTQAVAYLAELGPRGVDAEAAWAIADHAAARGVAKAVLRGHSDEVHWVAPYFAGFVTGGYDGRAIVWSPSPHVVFSADHGRVHAVVPAPAGGELAVGGDDGQLHVIASDGRVLATLPGHAGDVQHVAWSGDGAWLASADDHGNVFAWPHGREPAKVLARGGAAIDDVAFGGPTSVVAVGHDGALDVWDLAAGAHAHAQVATALVAAWTDGAHVAAVDAAGQVSHWHVAGEQIREDDHVETHIATKRVAFAPGGAWLAIGGVSGEVVRVEGHAVTKLGAHRTQVRSLAISDDGTRIADGGEDGSLAVRDLATGRVRELRGHAGRIRHVAFADHDQTLYSSDSEGVVRTWHLDDAPGALAAGPDSLEHLAVSADGSRAAAVDSAGELATWDTRSGVRTQLGHVSGRTVALAFAGATPITGTTDGAVTWWSAQPVKRTIPGTVKSIAVGGERVAVATSSGEIAMFALDGTPAPALAGHAGGTECVAFDATGTLLASGGQDRAVRVWRANAGAWAQVAALDGPQADTSHVAFAPRGSLLVAAGNDGTVRAWQVHDLAVDPASRTTVAQHTGAIGALAVSDRWIVSAGRDARISRASLANGRAGEADYATLSASATSLVLDAAGDVHVLARTGEVVRWDAGKPPVTVISHGVRELASLAADHFLIARDDGSLVSEPLAPRPLTDLRAALAQLTSYRLR